MSTQTVTITYTVCDGCHKNTLDDDIVIVRSKKRHTWREQVIDMCNECADKDYFICRHCYRVHGEDNPCEELAKIMASV